MKKKILVMGAIILLIPVIVAGVVFCFPNSIVAERLETIITNSIPCHSYIPAGRCAIRCDDYTVYDKYTPHYFASLDCPADKPFGGGWECQGCDYLGSFWVNAEHQKDFEICSNRKWVYTERENNYSILKQCPPNAPLPSSHFDSPFFCASCSDEEPVKTDRESCNKCPNRKYRDGWCIDKSCSELIVNKAR